MESQVDDPWMKLDLTANLYLSKTALNQLKKRAGEKDK
jgi:hypothetical protein